MRRIKTFIQRALRASGDEVRRYSAARTGRRHTSLPEATYWPDIGAICRLMAAHDSHRYVAVHDDVIIGRREAAIGGIPSGRIYQKHFAASAIVQACSSNAASPNSSKDWKAVHLTHRFNLLS